jgi:hypothetical protein
VSGWLAYHPPILDEHPPKPADPIPLEYRAAAIPEDPRARAIRKWGLALLISWVPHLCGIVSALAVVRSGSAPVLFSHGNITMLTIAAALLTSAACAIRFRMLRFGLGLVASLLTFLAQLLLAGCIVMG